MSDIDTAELRRLLAEANNPYAKPGPAAVAAIEFHARVPALLDELDRLRERVEAWQKASDTWKARAHALGWGKPIFSKPPEDE